MTSDGVRLAGKDAISLLRLLRGLECLVREESLEERHCVELMGATAAEADWQERLRGEVSAACGLLQELLDGYDPQDMVRGGADAGGEARSALGSTPDTKARLDLP